MLLKSTCLVVLFLCTVICLTKASSDHPLDSPPLFYKYTISNPIERRALCNDGTPYSFYIRQSATKTTKWVFRLQGGGWCWDNPTCMNRWKTSQYWMTSNNLPNTMTDTDCIGPACHGGILSSDPLTNPYFYDANHVYIWYCSSDSHVGNQTASTQSGGWYFYGKNIIKAVMEEVVRNSTLGFTNRAQMILITGDSAGGVGTMNNVDWMVEYLMDYSVKGAIYRAFIDAGWFLDIETYMNSTTSFQSISKNLIEYANVIYNVDCMNAYGKDEKWKCFHGQYVHGFIHTDMFLNEFLYDAANLDFDGLGGPPYYSSKQKYADQFRIDITRAQSGALNLFSASCFRHETEDTHLYYTVKVQGMSIANAVSSWFVNPKPARYVDTCNSINCNPTC